MKKLLLLTLAAITIISTTSVIAQNDGQQPGFSVSAGIKSLRLEGVTFSHDTHPDDYFLPGSNVPGSAGTTSLSGGQTYYASVGIGYDHPIPVISKSLAWKIEIGVLVGGQDDQHKNANDSRPDSNAAFIYSDSTWGLYGAVGLTYHIGKHFYFGGETGYDGVFVDNGWDRYSDRESAHSKLLSFLSGGPVVGYDFKEKISLEAGVRFGQVTIYEVRLIHKF